MILRNGEKIISDVEKVIDASDIFGTVLKAVKKYRAHSSILNIRERWLTTCSLLEMSLLKK